MRKLLSLLTLVFAANTFAQQIDFTAELDTNKILIGDHFKLQLTGKIQEGSTFQWPIMPDTIAGLDFVNISKIDTNLENGVWSIQQTLTLTSFDSGYVALPPLSLKSGKNEASSEALAVAVEFPEVSEQQDYFDIKEPLDPPFNWIPLLLSAAIVLSLGIGIWYLMKWLKNKKHQETLSPEQVLTPYEYAMQQLSEIEKEQLWQAGHIKEYYSRITDVMRLYMEREMGINAMESTAEELIDKMKEIRIASELQGRIDDLLQLSALVKYAKEKPGANTNELALKTVQEFLQHTKPAEKEENAELSV